MHLAGSSLLGLWFGGWGFLKEEEKQMEKKQPGDLVNIYSNRFSSTSREFPGFLLVSIGF